MLRREKPRLNSFREFLDIDALQEELQVCVWANCQTQSARVPRIDASRSPRLTHADHAAEGHCEAAKTKIPNSETNRSARHVVYVIMLCSIS
jgi:hypothetical protein